MATTSTRPVVRGYRAQQYAAGLVLLAVMAQMHRLGVGGRVPLAGTAGLILVSLVSSDELLHLRLAGGDLGRRLWPRVLVNLLTATPVFYTCGWGSLLGGIWIVGSVFHITWSGSAAWRPAAVGSGLAILLGELGIAGGLFPSYLPAVQAHLIGALQALFVVLVVAFLGQLVAARERAEAALAVEERRFRKMLGHSSDVVLTVDAAGRIQWISPSVRLRLGLDPDRLIGTPAGPVLGLEDAQLASWVTARPAEGPSARRPAEGPAGARRGEVRGQAPDGSARWHELVVQDLLDDPDVHGIVVNQRDVTEAVLAREELAYQATHDTLTGLANRARFAAELADRLRRTDGGTRRCAVLYVDLNGFKPINDTYGHAAGDAVLRAVAERLEDSTLGSDLSARLGGDEFAVLLTDLDGEAGAVAVARRVSTAIQAPLLVAGQLLTPRASIGIAVGDPWEHDADGLLHRADVAMYHAKRSGERWVVHHPDLEPAPTAPASVPPPG